jgi:hypothetical protein
MLNVYDSCSWKVLAKPAFNKVGYQTVYVHPSYGEYRPVSAQYFAGARRFAPPVRITMPTYPHVGGLHY